MFFALFPQFLQFFWTRCDENKLGGGSRLRQQKGEVLKVLGAISESNLLGNNAGGGFEVHLALVGRWSLPAFMGAAKGRVPPAKGGWKATPAKGV